MAKGMLRVLGVKCKGVMVGEMLVEDVGCNG